MTPPEEPKAAPPYHAALFMIQAYMSSRLLGMATKLGIPDLLADGPKSSASLAGVLGLSETHLLRLMRGFAVCGLLRHLDDGLFELTALGECLKTGENSLRDLAIRTYDIDYPAWAGMLDAMKAGVAPFEFTFGTGFYQYLSTDPPANDAFNHAMASMSASVNPAVIDAYEFPRTGRIVDVGGGSGVLLSAILKSHPELEGVLFDLPSALVGATANLEKAKVSDRCALVEGSFFDGVPTGGDLYILKLVLHNWNDDSASTILRQCRRAIRDSGRLLIAERVMPERTDAKAAQVVGSDLTMFVLMGGAERTESQFKALLEVAGFAMTRVITAKFGLSLIEAETASGRCP